MAVANDRIKSYLIQNDRSNFELREILNIILKANKMIVMSGAGMSVSAGIPDFRSAGGFYETAQSEFTSKEDGNKVAVKGKEFFDIAFFNNPLTRPLFYQMIGKMKKMCDLAEPTETHRYLKKMNDEGRLLRWYTQNIDGLEDRVGLKSNVSLPLIFRQANLSVSSPRSTQLTANKDSFSPIFGSPIRASSSGKISNLKVVCLHGILDRLACTLCHRCFPFTQSKLESFTAGIPPPCPWCTHAAQERIAKGKRAISSGILRPDIVLYSEHHPHGDEIGEFIQSDFKKNPDILLVIGTSLRVIGMKKMVKEMAASVHKNPNGLVLYINKTELSNPSEWTDIFDAQLLGPCDEWIQQLQSISNPNINIVDPFEAKIPEQSATNFFVQVKKASIQVKKASTLCSNMKNKIVESKTSKIIIDENTEPKSRRHVNK